MLFVKTMTGLALLATAYSAFGAPPPLETGAVPSPVFSESTPPGPAVTPANTAPTPAPQKAAAVVEPGSLGEFVQLQRKLALDELRAKVGQHSPEAGLPGALPLVRQDAKPGLPIPTLPTSIDGGGIDKPDALVRAIYALGGRKPRAELVVGNSVITVSPGDSLQGWTVAEISDHVLLERFEERKQKSSKGKRTEPTTWFAAANAGQKRPQNGAQNGPVERIRFTKVLAGANDDVIAALRKNERTPSPVVPPLPSAMQNSGAPQVINGNLRAARAMQDSVVQTRRTNAGGSAPGKE